jgi:hypothetical protein
MATLVMAAACNRDRSQVASDSGLARDLSLASSVQQAPATFQDTSLAPAPNPPREVERPAPARERRAREQAQPIVRTLPRPVRRQPPPQQSAPVAVTPAPSAPAPSPAPVAAHREIGAGATVDLTSTARVCTNTNRPGDKIVATVNSAITGSNGAVIPAGTAVVLEVASVTPGSTADGAQITFRVRSVVIEDKTYDAAADVTSLGTLEKTKVANIDPNADKRKVIGGAIAGAILGQMMGRNTKSTVIGAAAGAAAGAAVAKAGEKWEGCLPQGSPMRLTLNAPIVIS